MSNGDPLAVGITQPPFNRATAGTLLVHDGSAFGTQNTAFWVKRIGSPHCDAAIRGENFAEDPTPAPDRMQAGVLGMIPPTSAGAGVIGTTSAGTGPSLFNGETGVMGLTNAYGVVGRAFMGVMEDDSGAFISATGVVGECRDGVGVHGTATSGWGVIGDSATSTGVAGRSVSGAGVEGRSEQSIGVEGHTSQGLAGVRGQSQRSVGVLGASEQGTGVFGTSPTNAIQGWSTGTSGPAIGVFGHCEAGAGVQGDSTTGIGVAGLSSRGWAGYFEGNVIVRGGFYVVGSPKAAAVKHPDGTHRSLFCLESPESYFEDFGEVVLAGDSVWVKLDEDFSALVKRNRYQVFLTSYGPAALYVRKRSPDGFEIARVDLSTGGKPARMRVGYRIVARRADTRSTRLPKVEIPAHAPDTTELRKSPGKTRRTRADAHALTGEPGPLPATPNIPRPGLQALADAEPPETESKAPAAKKKASAAKKKKKASAAKKAARKR
jgi:hypothetical protein